MMTTTEEQFFKEIKTLLRNNAPNARIILYGSRARGDSKPSSDWDILVVLDKPVIEASDFDRISYPLYKIGWEHGEHVSTKIYSSEEWRKRSFTPFYKTVESEGIIL